MISRIPTSIKVLFACLLLSCCQTAPQTDLERIEALKKQVQTDAQTLKQLETKELVTLETDFIACDSMLQYLHPEAIDEAFQQLQLVKAYIDQFRETQPNIKIDMDSTLFRLDRLSADVESHYLSDSLTAIYLDDETKHVTLLSNQVEYFKDRFDSSQSKLDALKEKK